MFRSTEIHNWRQFSSVDVTFHDTLTVLTEEIQQQYMADSAEFVATMREFIESQPD